MLSATALCAMSCLATNGSVKHAAPQPDDGAMIRSLYDLREIRGDIREVESDPLDDLMGTIMGQYVGISHSELLDGVYVVEGTRTQIAEADELVNGMRAALARSYVTRVECWALPAEAAVAIGRALPSGGRALQAYEAIMGSRRESAIDMTREQSYIAEWSPVVSDSSVGYDPEMASAVSGLTATVLVGQQDGERVRIRLAGRLQEAHLTEREMVAGDTRLPISIPMVTRRDLSADAMIPLGTPVVMQVLPGMEEGECLVLVVRVSPTESVISAAGGSSAPGGRRPQ